jgi:integrase
MTQRKDGRWQKSITINGKRVFFYSSEPTERKALKDIEQQLLAYTEKEEKGATFEEVAKDWFALASSDVEPLTAYRYECFLKRAVDWFGDWYIKDITALDIEHQLLIMADQDYTTKTIKNQLSVIRLIFKYATPKCKLPFDPALSVTMPRGRKSQIRNALTEEEQRIVNNSVDVPEGLFAYTLLYTGLRRGEAIALKWDHIDFENKKITVTDNVVFLNNKAVITKPKTAAGIREVVLLDCLAEKLRPLMPADRSEFVFSGKTLHGGSYYPKAWKRYKKATGLNITPHQLRHTYATILFEAGIDVKDAQGLMGHSDISVTQNIYTHIRKSRLSETANKLNSYIKMSN